MWTIIYNIFVRIGIDMEESKQKKNIFFIIGIICGFLAIAMCLTTVALSVTDTYFAIYTLATSLVLLGLNRIGLQLSNFKKNMFENIAMTIFVFVLAVSVALTKYGIYFLISSMFCYSLTIIIDRLLKIKEDHSTQSIIFNILCMVFSFLFSFVFFFPAIYGKHATSVSNSNFIVLCYTAMIIVSSSKNIINPYHKKLKIHILQKIIRKSMVYEIILSLLIIVIICSVYFTCVEPNITSYVDSLWYSFSVITTIGFGDVAVTTTLGRILSVILGVSGIVVVALFTSVIVNLYNELNKKRESRSLEKIEKEVKELEEEERKKEQ